MTNAIEQSKREMYSWLAQVKMIDQGGAYQINSATNLENSLESYLELLRQDHKALHETARKRFEALQATEKANYDLQSRLVKMTEERDSIQLRLHAVDHAYNEQQSRGAALVSNSGESVASATPDGKTAAILGAIVDVQRVINDWAGKGLKAKEAMKLIAGIMNGQSVYLAMLEFDREEPCKLGEKDWKEIIAENEARSYEQKKRADDQKREQEERVSYLNGAVMAASIGCNKLLWELWHAAAPKDKCQHSFFAIGDEPAKCTYCCEVEK